MDQDTCCAPMKHSPRMSIDVRRFESDSVTEWYASIRPASDVNGPIDYTGLYGALASFLRDQGATLFAERLFVPTGETAPLAAIRAAVLGDLDDGVAPTTIESPAVPGHGVGLQIHAIRGAVDIEPVDDRGELIGRAATVADRRWLRLRALTAPQQLSAPEQAAAIFERAADILRAQRMTMYCVARTWVWMRDVLDWYDEFNAARNGVFRAEGLLDGTCGARFMPASTGIGAAPANGSAGGLEVLAVGDGATSISASHAAGEQCSPYSYGSAFARAVTAPSPAGQTLLVSGTAAIDPGGTSEFDGDIEAQIDATLQHIRALIAEAGWQESQITTATVYCKTRDVMRAFNARCGSLDWPRVEIIADVCRPELLFEAEVTLARSGMMAERQAGVID
jgi:enamine deaminase RidA (YjgF/YER057c/UK114 family)